MSHLASGHVSLLVHPFIRHIILQSELKKLVSMNITWRHDFGFWIRNPISPSLRPCVWSGWWEMTHASFIKHVWNSSSFLHSSPCYDHDQCLNLSHVDEGSWFFSFVLYQYYYNDFCAPYPIMGHKPFRGDNGPHCKPNYSPSHLLSDLCPIQTCKNEDVI